MFSEGQEVIVVRDSITGNLGKTGVIVEVLSGREMHYIVEIEGIGYGFNQGRTYKVAASNEWTRWYYAKK